MSHRNFADLDELLLRCHDNKARAYITEAVASYKTGALRSAILSTWIAIAFDFIDKVRQLELQGDKVAQKIGIELTAIQANADIVRSLAFERSILSSALNDLNFISNSEYEDLSRLFVDRHRCAHPSMNAKGEIFQPTAEQVRYHIRTAVDTMLSQPPTSGKAALAALTFQVEGEYFPTEVEKALVILTSSPIAKPRPSLVRNFVIVLIKRMLDINSGIDKNARLRAAAALNAVKSMHPETCSKTLSDELSPLIRAMKDENLARGIALAARLNDGEIYIDSDIRTRMEQYISITDASSLARVVEPAANLGFLQITLRNRLRSSDSSELIIIIGRAPELLKMEEIRSRAAEIYRASASYDQANEIANKLIIPFAHLFTLEQIASIVTDSFENSQVRASFQFVGAMMALRCNPFVNHEWWDALLQGLGATGQFSELFFGEQALPAVSVVSD